MVSFVAKVKFIRFRPKTMDYSKQILLLSPVVLCGAWSCDQGSAGSCEPREVAGAVP